VTLLLSYSPPPEANRSFNLQYLHQSILSTKMTLIRAVVRIQ